jgi:spore coat protein CotH/roadblock/LC7 domain-containing protein
MRKNTTLRSLAAFLICLGTFSSGAQNLPNQWFLNEAEHQLQLGKLTDSGIFNPDEIKTIYLEFPSSNWFTQLSQNYTSGTDIAATMTYEGQIYEQVGVGFRGNTSYMMVNGEDKKSFNINMDTFIPGQTLNGYDSFNLNNCFEDPSFLREFLYLYLIHNHIPAAKVCFVELVVNDVPWGLYPMVQQLDGKFASDWFLSNDGTRWRADAPSGGGGGGGGGPQWGDGTAALNDVGNLSTDYDNYYTLKSSTVTDPWQNLINTCDVLNNTPLADLPNELPAVMDVDRALWHIACENAFGDDDSYVMKGKMDYFVFWEIETDRITPIEYDGNSVLLTETSTWSPFYHADNVNYPLINRLLSVPIYRQRYLAHLRTIVEELIDATLDQQLIANLGSMIDSHVSADTKKLYSYSSFLTDVTGLNSKLQTRRNTIMANAEVNTTGASISNVNMTSSGGSWISPVSNEQVAIAAEIASPDGINSVSLYYSSEWVGNFNKVVMLDDGNSNDGAAGDGVFGGTLPGLTTGEMMRFYVEALENNTAKTASYSPVGAEHDVYIYTAAVSWANSTDVVINEIMANNNSGEIDEAGENEDWIELYNKGTQSANLTDYFLTDNTTNLTKWQLPDNTILAVNDYLIIWADEDSTQGSLHANFKLSSSGEAVTLLNNQGLIADQVIYEAQQSDMGFARIPNGVGFFIEHTPTFSMFNEYVSVGEISSEGRLVAYPNPTEEVIMIKTNMTFSRIDIVNVMGTLVYTSTVSQRSIDMSDLASGQYIVRCTGTDGSISTIKVIKK